MLTYSVKPRGGVVHAARGLRGADAARPPGRADGARPARRGALPRPPRVPLHDRPPRAGRRAVRRAHRRACSAAYAEGLRPILGAGGYDVVHSQDCLSANAALALRDQGVIDHVIRTVHHVDDFTSPSLVECQDRSITEPDHVLCVSQPWVERLRARLRRARRAGLQRRRHAPLPAGARRGRAGARRASAAGLGERFAVLTVGGIEPRKGSLTLLEGFAALRAAVPRARPAAADRRRHDAVRLPRTSVERFDARVAGARRRRRTCGCSGRWRRTRSSACSAPPTCSRSRRSRRASGSPRSRRSPPSCRSSPPTSTCSAASSPTARARC